MKCKLREEDLDESAREGRETYTCDGCITTPGAPEADAIRDGKVIRRTIVAALVLTLTESRNATTTAPHAQG
jgi:hypothetical protein